MANYTNDAWLDASISQSIRQSAKRGGYGGSYFDGGGMAVWVVMMMVGTKSIDEHST